MNICIPVLQLWCVTGVADGVSNNDNSAPCCKRLTTVRSDVTANVTDASNCVASSATDGSVNDFELLDESGRRTNAQTGSPANVHVSNADVKLREHNDRAMMSWQRIRSLIMAALGFVIRVCLSSVLLSRCIQVTLLTSVQCSSRWAIPRCRTYMSDTFCCVICISINFF